VSRRVEHDFSREIAADFSAAIPGLIWAYRFALDGSATELQYPVLRSVVDQIECNGSWLWLHLAQSEARACNFITQLPLPPRAIRVLLSHDEHLSLHLEGDIAFGIFADWQHALDDEITTGHSLAGEQREMGRLHFALSQGLIISTRKSALHSVHRMRRRLGEGARLESTSRMIESIIEEFSTSINDARRELAEALDDIEDRVLSEKSGDERRDLGKLRRRAVRVHRPLKALRRVTHQFEQRHEHRSDHAMVAVASRLAQRFDELDNEIVVIQDRAKLLHDEVSAKLTDQTNRHLYFLSILTALFLPPTLVVGVFGMNTKGLPLTEDSNGFLIALAICIAASASVYGLLRRLGIH
jgi:zinc transporter